MCSTDSLWLARIVSAQVTPEPRSVSLQDLCALLVKGLWMVSLGVGISPQTDKLSWVREGKAIEWNELLGLVSKAEPVVPKQLEKQTR